MRVPLLDLTAQFAAIETEVREAIDRVLKSQRFILGPEVEALEREIADYCQCDHAVGVSSGTDALLAALMAIGIKPGDEVLTTAYSFFATAGSVARLGAKPVFIDIDPLTFNLAPEQLESFCTDRTRAVIAVHLFGQMADMEPILEFARARDLFVIEDAAQSIGAEQHGRRAGSLGHIGCFSFFPSKNLGGFGDGGMVTCNDLMLAERIRILRNHGFQPKYYNKVLGGNFRLDALQAAVLRVKLRRLESWSEKRRQNASTYSRLFSEAGMTAAPSTVPCLAQGCRSAGEEECRLSGNSDPCLILPSTAQGNRHIYNQYVIRTSRRRELMAHLNQSGVGCEIYYPVPLHLQECLAEFQFKRGDFPASECAASNTLALPIYPELTDEMQRFVVDRIAAFHSEPRCGRQ